jgi:hypothetical protein
MSLDKIAAQAPEKFNIDKHIIAFAMSRMGHANDAPPILLKIFPKFIDHPVIIGLTILNIAQSQEPSIKIPNLCDIITTKLIDLFEYNLHNAKFKTSLAASLRLEAKTGILGNVVKVLSDQTPFIQDYNGYYAACKEMQILEKQILFLGSRDRIQDDAIILGQKLTVLASYIMCLIVLVILMV